MNTFKRVYALVCMLSMYCLNVMPLLYFTPKIVGNGCLRMSIAGIGALKSVTVLLTIELPIRLCEIKSVDLLL